jgi:hypothetical protein
MKHNLNLNTLTAYGTVPARRCKYLPFSYIDPSTNICRERVFTPSCSTVDLRYTGTVHLGLRTETVFPLNWIKFEGRKMLSANHKLINNKELKYKFTLVGEMNVAKRVHR